MTTSYNVQTSLCYSFTKIRKRQLAGWRYAKLTRVPPHHKERETFSRTSEASSKLTGYKATQNFRGWKQLVSSIATVFPKFKTKTSLVANANSLHPCSNAVIFHAVEAVIYITLEYGLCVKRISLPGTAVSRRWCAHAQAKDINFLWRRNSDLCHAVLPRGVLKWLQGYVLYLIF